MKLRLNPWLTALALAMAIGAPAPAFAVQNRVTITLVEINDLHANLIAHKDLIRNPDGSSSLAIRGGMARMKTIIDRIRNENDNTVVMNIGDTFHGGVEAFYSLGNAVADPLNALGIDVGVPGNWDFYFTPAVTRARYGRVGLDLAEVRFPGLANPFPVKRPNFPNLGANVRDITDIMLPRDFLPPTHIIERDGVKIGFIGFTSDIVEKMHPMLAQGMDFAWGQAEHLDLLMQHSRNLRAQGADIVAVMSELGIHKNIALSKALASLQAQGKLPPGLIDVFFSAHTHEATTRPIAYAQDGGKLYAPVVESGNDGYMGRMDITLNHEGSTYPRLRFRNAEHHWSISDMAWQLIAVDASVPEDALVKALVDAERAPFLRDDVNLRAVPFMMQRLDQPIDTVIGHLAPGSVMHQDAGLSAVLSRRHSLSSPFNLALTRLLRDVAGTEVAMSPGFRMGATLPEAGFLMENGAIASGDITLEDAYRFFPMYYGIATATTTGKHLKEVVSHVLDRTYSSDAWNTDGGWNYGYAGIDIAVNLQAGDQHRVTEIRRSADGSRVEDDDVLTIAGCRRLPMDFEGTLCGIGGFENVTQINDPATGTPWSLVDVFTQMLQDRGYALQTTGSNVLDASGTLQWPAAEFVQPLEGVGEYHVPHDPTDPCGYFAWNCMSN